MEKDTAHIQDGFLNCLRIGVVPRYYEKQRIESIVEFCVKYKFQNVMLFINHEEYNVGHMTKEEAQPWIETLKKLKDTLVEHGITISLNPWCEIGHLDRGRKLKPEQNFVTMVDYNGTQADISVCPMDKNWLAYFLDFYAYLIREIEPEVVWVEDDFRLHNHEPLEYGGCFCKHHMDAFNKELETQYTREEFLDHLYRKNPDEKVKQAFMEVNRRCMVELAEHIGKMVQGLGLGTKVALMSSGYASHCMEYRDWNGIQAGLSQDGPKIHRLNLPLYQERVSMKFYYQSFNQSPFRCRGLIPQDCHVLPELENGVFSTFAKEPETLKFQVESALPLEIEGMTYDIFDFAGNGTIEAFGYGQAVNEIQDYMTAVMESGYSYHHLQGITIPLDEKSAYNRPITNAFDDLQPDDNFFGALLQGHGISARCSKDKTFTNEVIALGGGTIYNFTDEQLSDMFSRNQVILDGKTAILLIERGLGHLIGADKYEVYKGNADIQSYEQVEGDVLVNDIPGYRASAMMLVGDYVAIQYTELPTVRSRVYDYVGNELGLGMVEVKSHLLIPYVVDDFQINHLHPLRQKIVCDYIDTLHKDFVRTDYSSIYAYYSKTDENVLLLINPTVHTLLSTRFKMTGSVVKRVYEIERDGVRREKKFSVDEEGFVVLSEPFCGMTTKCLVVDV